MTATRSSLMQIRGGCNTRHWAFALSSYSIYLECLQSYFQLHNTVVEKPLSLVFCFFLFLSSSLKTAIILWYLWRQLRRYLCFCNITHTNPSPSYDLNIFTRICHHHLTLNTYKTNLVIFIKWILSFSPLAFVNLNSTFLVTKN